MLKQTLFLLVVGMMSLSMVSCAGAGDFSNEKIRYKMTVTVETPEGIKTGSAVREAVHYTERSILPDQGGSFYKISSGEAVFVDLGSRGVLFELMGEEYEAKRVLKLLADKPEGAVDLLSIKSPLMLFYFKDINDPLSIQPARDTIKCTPELMECQNGATERVFSTMHRAFGDGVFLKRVEIERTDSDFDRSIVKRLPWLEKLKGGYISGEQISRGSPYGLHEGHFKVGE